MKFPHVLVGVLIFYVTSTVIAAKESNQVLALRLFSMLGQQKQQPVEKGKENKDAKQKSRDVAEEKKHSRPREVEVLVNDLYSSQAEFAVSSIFKLIEQGTITEKEWKSELLENAYRIAASVQNPYKKISTVSHTDTRAGTLSIAYRLNLDELSLKCRAIESMLLIDKERARNLFEALPFPKTPDISCSTPLVYDTSIYFDTLGKILKLSFTGKEIQQGNDVYLLEATINKITATTQLAYVAKTILSQDFSPLKLQQVLSRYSDILKNASGDPRTFSWTMSSQLKDSIAALAQMCESKGISNHKLIGSFREFLVKNMSAPCCGDRVPKGLPHELPKDIIYFNETLLSKLSPKELTVDPITLKEIQPQKILEAAEINEYWKSTEASQLFLGIKHLQFGDGKVQLSHSEREETKWNMEVARFIRKVEEWQGDDEKTAADYFNQKCSLLSILINHIPNSNPAQESVMRAYVSYLENNQVQRDSWIEWYMRVNHIFDLLKSRERERGLLLELFGNSKNRILSLIFKVDAIKGVAMEVKEGKSNK